MAVRDTFLLQDSIYDLAASASQIIEFYFPRPARIKRLFAVPSVAEPAHASQVLDVTMVDAGLDGSGSTTVAVLTNDSDLADNPSGPVRESGAWVAHDAKEIDFENRPGSPTNAQNEAYEVAAGSVLKVTVAKAVGATTGDVMVGLEAIWSD